MKRANALTWFLGAAVVVLAIALTAQTAYLVWLHRQLYTAVAGAGSDLEKLLNTDIGGSASPAPKPGKPLGPPHSELGDIKDLNGVQEQARRIVDQALADPALKGLLGDLGIEAPGEKPAPKSPALQSFRPVFDFQETPDRYIVTVELPGVESPDLHAEVHAGVLKVYGMRKGARFSESFAFPGPTVHGSENISFKDGRLTVTARKVVKASPQGEVA